MYIYIYCDFVAVACSMVPGSNGLWPFSLPRTGSTVCRERKLTTTMVQHPAKLSLSCCV